MKISLFFCLLILGACQAPQRELNLSEQNYTYFFDANGESRKIFYREKDGNAVVEGDIVLGTVTQVQTLNDLVESNRSRGAIFTRFRNTLWTGAKVPYRIDSSIEDARRIEQAIEHFESNTPLRFVERQEETDYVTFRQASEGCSANVGRSGGQQFINLGSDCSLGNVIHEIGHAVGLWHEQSRRDRDDHITIHWDNISAEERYNFDQHLTDGSDIGSYDYDSVMHYGAFAFSSNGKPTITRKDGSTSGLGNRNGLSAADIEAIQRIYSSRLVSR